MRQTRRFSLGLALAIIAVVCFGATAKAGPPLICFPFETGGAKSLPWGGAGWHEARADYDPSRLSADTLALLGPETPVLARMETLRRATIYAMKDPRAAADLLSRLLDRAKQEDAKGTGALAAFDAGYLIEAYKQAKDVPRKEAGIPATLTAGLDGYALVMKAINLRGGDPEMEFAAALMDWKNPEHLRKAVAGAKEGSLFAANLLSHYRDRGKTLAELRASVSSKS